MCDPAEYMQSMGPSLSEFGQTPCFDPLVARYMTSPYPPVNDMMPPPPPFAGFVELDRATETCKRLAPVPAGPVQPHAHSNSVARRNERERKRVRMVNLGFAKLRQYVPLATRGKRLSKVETLRSAIEYIRQLQQLLLHHQHSQQHGDGVPSEYFLDPQRMHHPLPHPPMMASDSAVYGDHPPTYMSSSGGTSCTWSVTSSPTPSLESDIASPYGLTSGDPSDLALLPWSV